LLLTEDCPFTVQDLADEMGAPLDLAQDLITLFCNFRMMHLENGVYYVTNWDKRQFASDDSAERVRRYRERHEPMTKSNGNADVTLQDRYSNAPETDTDTETESETEADTDKREQVAPPVNGSPQKRASKPRESKAPKEPPPAAIEHLRQVTGRYPNKSLWADIQAVVGTNEQDLVRLDRTAKAWIAMGWNPTNYKGILQHFHDKRIPGDDMKSRGSPTGPPEPASYAALRALSEEEGWDFNQWQR